MPNLPSSFFLCSAFATAVAASPAMSEGHVHGPFCGHGIQEWDGTGERPTIDHGGLIPGHGDAGPQAFRIGARWSNNANAAGFTGNRGDGITLTYGVVPDGTNISGGVGEPASPSNLVAFLNQTIGPRSTWEAAHRRLVPAVG